MAALLHKMQDHIPSHNSNSSSSNAMASAETIEQEKHFIAEFAEPHYPLPPEEVQQDPRNKELGRSARGLSVEDFDLVRTLGTGACCACCLLGGKAGCE
jgi:protein kinase A